MGDIFNGWPEDGEPVKETAVTEKRVYEVKYVERLEARIKCDHAILQGAKKAMVQAADEIEWLTAELKQANAVVDAVVKLGKDCRYAADDWVLSPELAEKYVEPVYQQALAALETDDG